MKTSIEIIEELKHELAVRDLRQVKADNLLDFCLTALENPEMKESIIKQIRQYKELYE